MAVVYRLVVRGLLAVAVVAFLFALVIAERPEMLLGDPIREEALQQGEAVNPDLANATSIVDLRGETPVSRPLPERTVAITFDDGPDPVWTREIQAVLDEHGVPGTFFVVGEHVLEYPDIVRELHAAGHEIGNHTYTHPRVSALSGWQVRLQYKLTQEAVANVIGEAPKVFRPPYSGSAPFFPVAEMEAATLVSRDLGIVSLLTDRIPKDYDLSVSVDELVAQAMPPAGAGAAITFHDGGGDRANTIEALDRLITELKENGYRFVTASEFIGLSSQGPSAASRTSGLLITAAEVAPKVVTVFAVVSIAFAVYGVVRLGLLVVLALRQRRVEKARLSSPTHRPFCEPVSVVVPAYNEEVGIAAAVSSFVDNDYQGYVEVIVVDDGSTDRTAEIAEQLGFPNVRVIRQANAGKPAALNTGINAARTEIIVMVDGDTVFERDTIRRLVQHFADPTVGAVAGNAKVGNRTGWWTRLQHLEYTLASSLERRAYAALRTTACVPGAIGAFRRLTLKQVGGVSADTLAEDSDLTMAIARAGWTVAFAPDARAWTETPATLRGLYRQRFRWSYGVLQALAKHRGAVIERGAGGRLGRRVFPQQFFNYLGALAGPLFDLVFLINLFLRRDIASATVVAWVALNVMFIAVTAVALRLDGEKVRSAVFTPMQQFVYRQVLYLAVLRAISAAVCGIRLPWNKIRRTGDVAIHLPPTPAVPAASTPASAAVELDLRHIDVIDLRDDVLVGTGE